ncbi:MAG: hypothetical protein AB7G34_10595 [Hyphomicrobiales bacterium]
MFKKTIFAAVAASIVGAGAIGAGSSPAEATFLKKDRAYDSKAAYYDGRERKGLLWWKDKDRSHGWKHKKHKKHYVEPAPQYKYKPMK